jgi:hypothetical protein
VATNVPYLGRGKQDEKLKAYCERAHAAAKADLATCFVERCLAFCAAGGTAALVTPQNWLFLGTYKKLRKHLLESEAWNAVARLGPRAFETISGEVVNVALLALSARRAAEGHAFAGLDASEPATPGEKAEVLRSGEPKPVNQEAQLNNPEFKVVLEELSNRSRLSAYATYHNGICTGDYPRFGGLFWEHAAVSGGWECQQSTVVDSLQFGGLQHVVKWDGGSGALLQFVKDRLGAAQVSSWIRGREAWGREGVAVSAMRDLPVARYFGALFDDNTVVVIPNRESLLPAIWSFCSSPGFNAEVRKLAQNLKVRGPLVQAPFDLAHWQKVAAEKYPHGLPKPHSDDPTQWLFSGYPRGSDRPLQVAVARLVGYRWPRQTGSSFPDCPALGADGLEAFADEDGIVCLAALRGERPAAERLRALLAAAYGEAWSPGALAEALAREGSPGASLEAWLRDEFFAQHCALFHQRPFVWHIWDGASNGFSALVNYHKLAAPNGEGRRTLEKLIYSYLGDWIERQRDEQKREVAGSDARLAAAEHLKRELEKILAGEPPYDLFVRWKPLHEQPIGWEPDLDDGVRINIRPFMTARPLGARARNACILRWAPNIRWDKDRGNEPSRPREDFPWFWSWDESDRPDFAGGERFDGKRWNGLHYTTAAKRAARERKARGDGG